MKILTLASLVSVHAQDWLSLLGPTPVPEHAVTVSPLSQVATSVSTEVSCVANSLAVQEAAAEMG